MSLILLQIDSSSSHNDTFGAFVFFVISLLVILVISLSGRVSTGIQIPGIKRPLAFKYKEILMKYFSYYNGLDRRQQKLFEKKVQYFIHMKQFIPRGMDKATDEMKVLISACAVQLTFGFPYVFLSHFKRILIYPDDYYSTINRTYHKGEVNPRLRAIVLSWKHFVDGYITPDDGRNLGLHEMAHAMRLENRIFNGEFKFFDPQILRLWNELSSRELAGMRAGEAHMFRDYAASNHDEFFAVAVENFFERPEQFYDQMPKLYAVMVKLLKQDPWGRLQQNQEK